MNCYIGFHNRKKQKKKTFYLILFKGTSVIAKYPSTIAKEMKKLNTRKHATIDVLLLCFFISANGFCRSHGEELNSLNSVTD